MQSEGAEQRAIVWARSTTIDMQRNSTVSWPTFEKSS